ncbi:MAG: hypothetical protein U0V74_17080 [Chitinophagales bacterium]
MLKKIYIAFALVALLLITSCLTDKKKANVNVPTSFNPSRYSSFYFPAFVEMNISGRVIGTAAAPTYPYPTPYPAIVYGGTLSFSGNIELYNEFYLVEKVVKQPYTIQCYDPGSGTFYYANLMQGETVSFIWNTDWLYPWLINLASAGVVDPLMQGDTITTIRIATNEGNEDFNIPQSTTNYTIVKYDQSTGNITPVVNQEQATPVIKAHSLVGIKQKFIYKDGGLYRVTITVDNNNQAPSEDKGTTQQETNTVNLINKG